MYVDKDHLHWSAQVSIQLYAEDLSHTMSTFK